MRHLLQLCHQIKETLSMVFPVDIGLTVKDVIPGNSGSHLIVLLKPQKDLNISAAYEQLEEIKAELKDDIFSAICRSRVPDLTYRIKP